jgi:Protein of unknown function (DUF3433)
MATIRRKPVSSAFYASDFPPVFSLGPALPPSPKKDHEESSRTEGQIGFDNAFQVATCHQKTSQPSENVLEATQPISKDACTENVLEGPDAFDSSGKFGQTDAPLMSNRYGANRQSKLTWDPFWLRTSTLLAFIILYAFMLVCTVVLWRVSRDQNGFTTPISANRYTWTCGPTAIVVLVSGLWRQVDHHCKALAPWQEMKEGAPAARTMLLDYVSPPQLTSLWLAFNLRTSYVIATMAGFAFLNLAVRSLKRYQLS